MAFLQIRQLCKYYNQQSTKAVNEFTLDIEEGEIISLLGLVVVARRRHYG
ncbi:hypothetical protein [Geomicrobium sp. JCM 19055]